MVYINPMLNTTDPNWASEQVIVRTNNGTPYIQYDHVVLAFVFRSPVQLTSIRLSLFNYPQWGIGAPNITVYAPNITGTKLSSCDSLVQVIIPLQTVGTQYNTCILWSTFNLKQPLIVYIYIMWVKFSYFIHFHQVLHEPVMYQLFLYILI